MHQWHENNIISMDFVWLENNLTDPQIQPLTRMLVSETSKGMRVMPIFWECMVDI